MPRGKHELVGPRPLGSQAKLTFDCGNKEWKGAYLQLGLYYFFAQRYFESAHQINLKTRVFWEYLGSSYIWGIWNTAASLRPITLKRAIIPCEKRGNTSTILYKYTKSSRDNKDRVTHPMHKKQKSNAWGPCRHICFRGAHHAHLLTRVPTLII